MGASTGLKAVVSESARALPPAPLPLDDAQMSFLPETSFVGTASPQLVAERGERERKAGRPKGAGNLSTAEWRKFLLSQGRSPLVFMMGWLMLSPEEMAQRLGITTAEAFDRQAAMADRLAPYIHSKMAMTDEAGKTVPNLALFIGGEVANASGAAVPPWHRAFETLDGEIVEYQGLGEMASDAAQPQDRTEKENTSNANEVAP